LQQHFDVSILAPHAPDAKYREAIDGMNVYRFQYCFTKWERLAYGGGILANLKKNRLNYLLVPFFLLSEFLYLLKLCRKNKFDAIHAHWLIPQGLVALLARALLSHRPIIICTSHGGDLFGLSGSLLTRLKQFIVRRVDRMTVVSRAMRDYAQVLSDRHDIAVISMGVDLQQRFTPAAIPRKPYSLLYAGRLVEKKGVKYLIHAMQKILQRHQDVELIIAGDGPENTELRQFAIAEGVSKQIHFIGSINNSALCNLYRECTVFIAPSIVARDGDQEGLGLVLVEALGCECPVVATDLPAIQDVIQDGITGLVAKQKDSNDLADKIITLLDNPDLRTTLGQTGRAYVLERFDWDLITERYAELFDCLPSCAVSS
jgi:glycosyltransferase involved in cell wall biosynthesis